MKDAIILAAYSPTFHKEYLDDFFEKLDVSRSDIFVGINPPVCNEFIEYISTIPNVKYEIVSDDLVIDSDASAFQKALQLYRARVENYELVTFAHFKGMIKNNDYNRNVIKQFYKMFSYKQFIKRKMFSNPRVGTYSIYIRNVKTNHIDVLNQFANFKYDKMFFNYLYVFTIYMMKAECLDKFVDNCDESFFNKNLIECGCDRYFFERDFPHIAWKNGYLPLFEVFEKFNFFDDVDNNYDSYVKDVDRYYV